MDEVVLDQAQTSFGYNGGNIKYSTQETNENNQSKGKLPRILPAAEWEICKIIGCTTLELKGYNMTVVGLGNGSFKCAENIDLE